MCVCQLIFIFFVLPALKKKLFKLSQDKQCTEIRDWMQSIVNHLYWCAISSPSGDGELIGDKWLSLSNHIVNEHHNHGGKFNDCLHGELSIEEKNDTSWLKKGMWTVVFLVMLGLYHPWILKYYDVIPKIP